MSAELTLGGSADRTDRLLWAVSEFADTGVEWELSEIVPETGFGFSVGAFAAAFSGTGAFFRAGRDFFATGLVFFGGEFLRGDFWVRFDRISNRLSSTAFPTHGKAKAANSLVIPMCGWRAAAPWRSRG